MSIPYHILEKISQGVGENIYFDLDATPFKKIISRFSVELGDIKEVVTERFTLNKIENSDFVTFVGDMVRVQGTVFSVPFKEIITWR